MMNLTTPTPTTPPSTAPHSTPPQPRAWVNHSKHSQLKHTNQADKAIIASSQTPIDRNHHSVKLSTEGALAACPRRLSSTCSSGSDSSCPAATPCTPLLRPHTRCCCAGGASIGGCCAPPAAPATPAAASSHCCCPYSCLSSPGRMLESSTALGANLALRRRRLLVACSRKASSSDT